jgi:hypothetical protein
MQSNKEGYFARTRTNATINPTSSSHHHEKSAVEIGVIRKEIEALKEEVARQEGVGHLTEKICYLE